jgi:predicted nucleic acid-binding protein
MTFADIPAGLSIFVDANIFVYHFLSHATFGPACHQLLERAARQEIVGYTAADVLSDVAHRVMTLEAIATFNWSLRRNTAEPCPFGEPHLQSVAEARPDGAGS